MWRLFILFSSVHFLLDMEFFQYFCWAFSCRAVSNGDHVLSSGQEHIGNGDSRRVLSGNLRVSSPSSGGVDHTVDRTHREHFALAPNCQLHTGQPTPPRSKSIFLLKAATSHGRRPPAGAAGCLSPPGHCFCLQTGSFSPARLLFLP